MSAADDPGAAAAQPDLRERQNGADICVVRASPPAADLIAHFLPLPKRRSAAPVDVMADAEPDRAEENSQTVDKKS